jgi:hypothetical protein
MEKRPRRFSLAEAFFEGSRTDGCEDCLSTQRSDGEKREGKEQELKIGIYRAEFRSTEKKASATALRT